MFAEATGAFGIQVNYLAVAQVLEEQTIDINHAPLDENEKRILRRALHSSTVASLGLFSFVLPYERYKKIASRYPDRNLNVGEAFGLQNFNSEAALRARYPETIVNTWNVDRRKPSWFADVVRNSFAHGQSAVVYEGNILGVEITNAKDGITPDFDIVMTLRDFGNLMATALDHFIATIVDGGAYQPLSKLLQWELA